MGTYSGFRGGFLYWFSLGRFGRVGTELPYFSGLVYRLRDRLCWGVFEGVSKRFAILLRLIQHFRCGVKFRILGLRYG